MVEPAPGRCATEKVVVLCKAAPDRPWIRFDGAAVPAADAETFEAYALAVKHAKDVVIRHHEETGRIGKRLVLGIPARIRMAVRRYDRQAPHPLVETAGHSAGRGIGRQEPVLVVEHR